MLKVFSQTRRKRKAEDIEHLDIWTFGHKVEEVTENWRKFFNGETS